MSATSNMHVGINGDASSLLNAINKAAAKIEDFEKSTKKSLAPLKTIGEVFQGGGAVAGLTIAGKVLNDLTSKALELRDAFNDGSKSAGDITEELLGSLPVLGDIWKSGRNIRELFTGEEAELRKSVEHTQAMVSAREKLLEIRMKEQAFIDQTNKEAKKIEQDNEIKRMKLNGASEADIKDKQTQNNNQDTREDAANKIKSFRESIAKDLSDQTGKLNDRLRKAQDDFNKKSNLGPSTFWDRIQKRKIYDGIIFTDEQAKDYRTAKATRDNVQNIKKRFDAETAGTVDSLKQLEDMVKNGTFDPAKAGKIKQDITDKLKRAGIDKTPDFSAFDAAADKASKLQEGEKLDSKLSMKEKIEGMIKGAIDATKPIEDWIKDTNKSYEEGLKENMKKELEEKKKLADRADKIRKDTQKTSDDLVAPGLGDYNEKIRELNDLVSQGAITYDEYTKAAGYAKNDLMDKNKVGSPSSALSAGSSEAANMIAKAFNQSQFGGMNSIDEKQLQAMLTQEQILKQIAANTNNSKPVVATF